MSAQSIKESRGSYLADAAKELVAAASESRFDAATFLEKFESMLHAPGAIQSIRGLVLDLAVTGKLSKQLESDGTAVEQLQLIEGDKSVAEIDNLKRKLPHTWAPVPCRLLLDLETGKRMKGGAKESGVISLGGEHIRPNGTVDYSVPRFVSQEFFEDMKNGHVRVLDTLMVKDGATTGKAAFVESLPENGKAAVNEHVFILRWREPIDNKLGFYFIRAFASSQIASKSSGIIGGIRREAVLDLVFPVPPLAEQKRIVAKVDELMGLCDRLEALEAERKDRHASLSRAALARFAASPTPTNLKFLFHNSFDVEPANLRIAILRQAFAGKLVRQDSYDVPASELLEAARAEKARLIETGLVKKEPWSHKLKDAKSLYALPLGWEWAHVSDVVEKVTVGFVGSMKSQYCDKGIPFLRCQNVRENRYEPIGLTFIAKEFHKAISKSILKPGDVVVTRSGNVGVTCVIPDSLAEANCSDLVIVKRPIAIVPAFLSYFINSIARGQIEAKTVGIALTHFNTESVAQMTVPLPPLAEQKRIVAKVDELMALVDHLEQQLANSRTLGQQLLEAVVAELTN